MVGLRPVSATLNRRSEPAERGTGGNPAVARVRPQSAIVRATGDVYGRNPTSELQHVNRCGTGTTTTTLSGSRPRPLSAKPHASHTIYSSNSSKKGPPAPAAAPPSAASLATESCKRCIRDIFDVCEQLHLEEAFTTALHSFLKRITATDVGSVSAILQALLVNRSATLQVLRRVDARERVLQCLDDYIQQAFLEPCGYGDTNDSGHGHHIRLERSGAHHQPQPRLKNDFVSETGLAVHALLAERREAVEESLLGLSKQQLTMLTSEADAILESLSQCTEGVVRELNTWQDSMSKLWGTVEIPGGVDAALHAQLPPGVVHHQQQPVIGVGMYFDSPRKVHVPPAAMPPTVLAAGSSPVRSLLSSRNNSNLQSSQQRTAGSQQNSRGGSPTQRSSDDGEFQEHTPAAFVFLWRSLNYQQKMSRDVTPFVALQEAWSLGNLARAAEVLDRKQKRERLLANNDALRTHAESVAAKARDEFLNIAATKIQSHFRRHQATMWFQMYMLKKRAIRTIESWWRRLKTKARFVRATDGSKAVVHLQRLWRAYAIRKEFPRMLNAHRAARKIQRWWRFWDCHMRMIIRKMQRQHRLYAAAVVARIVHRFVRQWKGRQRQRCIAAGRTLQRVGRGASGRAELRARLEAPNYTVVVPGHLSLVQPGAHVGDGDDHEQSHFSPHMSTSSPYHSSTASPHRSISSPVKSIHSSKHSASTPETPEPVVVVLRRGAPEAIRGSIETSLGRPAPVAFDQASALGLGGGVVAVAPPLPRPPPVVEDRGTMPMTPREDMNTQQVAASNAMAQEKAIELVAAYVLWKVSNKACATKRRFVPAQQSCDQLPAAHPVAVVSTATKIAGRRSSPLHTAAARAIQGWWRERVAPRLHSRQSEEVRQLSLYTATMIVPAAADTTARTSRPTSVPTALSMKHALHSLEAPVGAPTHVGAQAIAAPREKWNLPTLPAAQTHISVTEVAQSPIPRLFGNQSSDVQHRIVPIATVTLGEVRINRTPADVGIEFLRRRKRAATRIATWAAKILRRRAARTLLEHNSANVIARAFRTYKLQRNYFLQRRARNERAKQAAELELIREYEAFMSLRRAAALQILFWYQQIKCKLLLRKLDTVNDMIRKRPDRDDNARRIQRFWTVARARVRCLELHKADMATRSRQLQQERVRSAAVRIQGQFRRHQRRHELEQRRAALRANHAAAATVIQKHVRKWLAKNTFWQAKISKLSMFRELQRLRQKERVRISGAPIAAPKHAW